MLDLITQLQETIENLEKVRDKQNPPSQEIVAQIDTLYTQKEDLIKAAIDETTAKYKTATDAMEAAKAEAKKAIASLTQVEKTIATVASAIEKVAGLLKAIGVG